MAIVSLCDNRIGLVRYSKINKIYSIFNNINHSKMFELDEMSRISYFNLAITERFPFTF